MSKIWPEIRLKNDDTVTNELSQNAFFQTTHVVIPKLQYRSFISVSNELKQVSIVPVHEKGQTYLRKIIDQSAFSRPFPKFMEGV